MGKQKTYGRGEGTPAKGDCVEEPAGGYGGGEGAKGEGDEVLVGGGWGFAVGKSGGWG